MKYLRGRRANVKVVICGTIGSVRHQLINDGHTPVFYAFDIGLLIDIIACQVDIPQKWFEDVSLRIRQILPSSFLLHAITIFRCHPAIFECRL